VVSQSECPIEMERTEFGWWAKGHLPKADVVRVLRDEDGVQVAESAVYHRHQRFLPVRGEPSDNLADSDTYTWDDWRHGYWYDCKPGRGVQPYTWVDEWETRRLPRQEAAG
jgi:hypothetical protein